jgi:hypothetical protein
MFGGKKMISKYAGVTQLVEYLVANQIVVGSTPAGSTILLAPTVRISDKVSASVGVQHFAGVTQLVEYLVANQIVVGSSPITRLFLIWRKNEKNYTC